MPMPEYAHGAWISKRGSKVKHVAIIDRKMARVPWRPICNAHANSDEIRQVGERSSSAVASLVWWVDLNPTAWPGRSTCKNCIRVVEELNQMVSGVDPDSEKVAVATSLNPDDDITLNYTPGWPPQQADEM